MATQPPTKTLTDDLKRGAFPNTAPNQPKTIKAKLTAPITTPSLTLYSFINDAASNGTNAPTEKARAEAAAACNGFGKLSFSSSSFIMSPSPLVLSLCLSLFIWATSISSCEYTDTNSPMAMLQAPATNPANPVSIMTLMSCLTAPTPIINDAAKTPAQRFVSEDGVKVVRGRILGGTSMLNGGFFSRADDQFYNESGVDWDKDMVEKAYQWVEDTIVFSYNLSTFQSILRKGLLQAGVGPDNGFTLQHLVGTKTSGSTFDDQGRRHGAVELLNKGVLNNLRVAVEAYVEKIIFSSSNTASRLSATGVIYKDSKGRIHRAFVKDKGEVILSAGAIGSPQLLLLSGVGPVPHLSSLHIPVVYSNPDVGNFISDNPRNNINIVAPFALDASTPQVVGVVGGTGDFNVIEGVSYILPFSFPQPFGLFPNSTSPLQLSVANILHKISGPQSTGSLRLLSSAEVKVSPAVRFNYFSEPVDLAGCVRGMRKIGNLLKTDSFEELKFENLEGEEVFKFLGPSLPKNQSDDASMETFCRSTVTTVWHYHGGCLLGKVVDGDYRVKGANSLRVVDGSTFKASPGTNPQATLMMLGRYIGLKILQERRAEK